MDTTPPRKTAHLVLVGCAAQKREGGPYPAGQLYTSTLFKLAQRWAEQNGDAWRVLSAGRGLLDPAGPMMSYDTKLQDRPADERERWARGMGWAVWCAADYLRDRLEADEVLITCLAGEAYCTWIPHLGTCPQFDARAMFPIRVELPLQGLQIGERLQWLSRATQQVGEVRDLFTEPA